MLSVVASWLRVVRGLGAFEFHKHGCGRNFYDICAWGLTIVLKGGRSIRSASVRQTMAPELVSALATATSICIRRFVLGTIIIGSFSVTQNPVDANQSKARFL